MVLTEFMALFDQAPEPHKVCFLDPSFHKVEKYFFRGLGFTVVEKWGGRSNDDAYHTPLCARHGYQGAVEVPRKALSSPPLE